MKGQPRCTAFLDYTDRRVIRCKLKAGHGGVHESAGWEPLVGASLVLVRVLQKRAGKGTGS